MIDPRFYTLRQSMTVGDLADRYNIELPATGAVDEVIQSLAALTNSRQGDVTFFSNKKHKAQLKAANATACLTTQLLFPMVVEAGMIAVICNNPRMSFAKLSLELVDEGGTNRGETSISTTANIHPSAVIGEGVVIGARTYIGANSVIEGGVEIGDDCRIEALVSVAFTRLGDRCHLKSGAVIGGAGFGMVKDGEAVLAIPHLGRVIIGNNVHIGSNTCIDRGQLGDTVISDHVKIDNQVQIGHNTIVGEGTIIAGQAGISGSCVIGKNALLAGRAILSDHVTIGESATLAANGFAMSDVPSGEVYFGSPALPIREHMRSLVALKKLARRK